MILLRSLLFTVVFYVCSAVMAIVMAPLMLAPRRWMIGMFRVWARSTIWALAVFAGIKLEVRGREHMPTGPALLAPKHQCLFDTIVPLALMPDCCQVMKKELMIIPFYGWYAAKSEMIVVDREGAAKTMRKLIADGRDRLAQNRQLLIFPEGLGVACTPVATNSGVHWPAHGFLRHPGTIVVEFLEPIAPGLKRPAFMRELERRVETASNALLAEGL